MMKSLLLRRIPHGSCYGAKHSLFLRRLMSQLADIRQHLQQYQAGSVELSKDADTGIAVLTLNNPSRKNALSGSMMVELSDHVTELSQWEEGKGLILRGADDTFCSGGDLKTLMSIAGPEGAEKMSRLMHDTLTRLRSLPLVSLALIQGMAIGGGAEMAVACDVRAMTENARVGFVQMRMGLTTGWGGGTNLLRLVGRPTALRLLGSTKILTCQEALEEGLVEHALPEHPSPLHSAQTLLMENYCRGPVQLVRGVKVMVGAVDSSGSVGEALEWERKVFAPFWLAEAHQAALNKNLKHS
ncbi:hypothetical protein ACOMHN_009180 [Nucella lapillus]